MDAVVMDRSGKGIFRRIFIRFIFWGFVVANFSVILPAMGQQPGPLDSLLRWNNAHIKPAFSAKLEWWGIHHRWWMFAHYPGEKAHVWNNVTYEIDVTDAHQVTHIYTIPPPESRGFFEGYLGFRHFNFCKCLFMFSADHWYTRNLILWHVQRDMSLSEGRTSPFTVRYYGIYTGINPPGSLTPLSPPNKFLITQSVVTPTDLQCMQPWPSHAKY